MQARIVLLFSIALVGLTRANGEAAAVSPFPGSAAVPVKQTISLVGTDAITIPRMLSYQGRLTDTLGRTVPDGDYQLTFRLYQQENGGSPFWIESQTVRVRSGIFSVLLGAITPITSLPENGEMWLSLQVGITPELTPRLRVVSSAFSFLSERAANSDRLQDKDTTAFVRTNQINSITSAMIVDGTIVTSDIANDAITSAQIQDNTIVGTDLNQMGAAGGQVLKWTGSIWAPGNDEVGGDNAWVRGTPDSVLYTIRQLGIARGGANNIIYGSARNTHINLGAACTTGTNGQNYSYCTVNGGYGNTASGGYTTVGGGGPNRALDYYATVAGGSFNTATSRAATVAGGYVNTASGNYATVGGGYGDTALAIYSGVFSGYRNKAGGNATDTGAVVGGGYYNLASAQYTTVSGGYGNTAASAYATISGGYRNTVSNLMFATVGGGRRNTASGASSTVAGGDSNTASGIQSTVGGGLNNVASSQGATVSGGAGNSASGWASMVSGGYRNTATGYAATVSGGEQNAAMGYYAFVGGGYADTVKAHFGGVLSGYSNLAGDDLLDTAAIVCGGKNNSATGKGAFVGGGMENTASGVAATVAGGWKNHAVATATVSGGYQDTAWGNYSTVSGGALNIALSNYATVGGGWTNIASGEHSMVGGGWQNTAAGELATVGGGGGNAAAGDRSTVGGGALNKASSDYATVAGGCADTAAASYSFAVGNHSVVPSTYSNSAAFNGQTATASNQTRVGALSKASGSFTIDHPLDPYNKILNHYFIEGPEMRNIYEGSVILDVHGRAEVKLPDYFEALNRNPHIQLTGVGSSDVYVAEDVSGNRFVIGGKPGTKVYWQVTGERQDVSAEATRRMMPVEQPKTGALAGRMLDDEFLSGCMEQLEREGKAAGINFRTAEGRRRYEKMKNPPQPEKPKER